MGFLEELGDLIDRPCQRKECSRFVPESSPSDDFCSETCESAWRAENNGCEYVRGFGGGEVLVPEGHPAEPTHRPPSTGLVEMPFGVGLFQILSSPWEGHERIGLGTYGDFNSYRNWARSVMQYASPETFAEPPQGPRAQIQALAYASDIVSRRQEMQRTITNVFGVPYDLVGAAPRPGNLLWMFDETSLLYPQRTMRREWMDQFRDDGDWLLDTLDIVLEFLIYDAPEAIGNGLRRAWRFVTRS